MLVEERKQVILNSIMENSQEIITVLDLEFNFVVCNRSFLKLMNFFHDSKVIGKNISEIIPPECIEIVLKNLENVLKTREPQSYAFNICNCNGMQVLSQLSVPIVEDGEITGILSVARNITNEESLKLKLMEKICDLNTLLENKKQLEAQKELFLTTLTHDLKNPVQAQLMSLKMLKSGTVGKLNVEQQEILDILLESSNYMQEMLYSILKTYKYDNGIIELNKTVTDVELLVKTCINEVNALAKSRGLKIVFEQNIENKKIYSDSEQLRRVVANLINNAINYAYKNSKIYFKICKNDKYIVFKITNKGYPIPENIKNRIFEKYVSGNSLKGIGLGLYFSKKVIEAHGGSIRLESSGETCSFIFELPLFTEDKKSKINWK